MLLSSTSDPVIPAENSLSTPHSPPLRNFSRSPLTVVRAIRPATPPRIKRQARTAARHRHAPLKRVPNSHYRPTTRPRLSRRLIPASRRFEVDVPRFVLVALCRRKSDANTRYGSIGGGYRCLSRGALVRTTPRRRLPFVVTVETAASCVEQPKRSPPFFDCD